MAKPAGPGRRAGLEGLHGATIGHSRPPCVAGLRTFFARPEVALMAASLLLAIDQGTTSTRAVFYDQAGQTLASAGWEIRQHYPRPGWVEHDPEEIWQSVGAVVAQALQQAGREGSQV